DRMNLMAERRASVRAAGRALLILTVTVLSLVGLTAPAARADGTAPAGASESGIILFPGGTDAARPPDIGQALGGPAGHHFHPAAAPVVRLAAARLAALLPRHPEVVAVVPDRRVEVLGKKTGGESPPPAQVVPAGVLRIGASPGVLAHAGSGVGVAVVDTG